MHQIVQQKLVARKYVRIMILPTNHFEDLQVNTKAWTLHPQFCVFPTQKVIQDDSTSSLWPSFIQARTPPM